MLQLKNETPFKATMLMLPDPDGVDSVYAIVKGTFAIGERLELAEEQLPLTLKDEFYDEPQNSSVKLPADTSLIKPGTDVLMHGTAWAPDGEPTIEMRVSLNVANIEKTVIVTGDRIYSGPGATISAPEPFESIPLVWERAFGGTDHLKDDPTKGDGMAANPVGTGFRISNGVKPIDGMKVPNVELEKERVQTIRDRPTPAGFAALGPNYQPRLSFVGTYDEEWEQSRSPFLPKDFDSRFFHSAPADQIVADYLNGDETVRITGATPNGQLEFQLPGIVPEITYTMANQPHVTPVHLDTVLIEPDEMRVSLVWRTVLQVDKKVLQVSEVAIAMTNIS
jgi:hypothetical protein